jgi:cellulose synthase/poly-beta-1,6-N-acetylglucosamine synthase-like glycosyltransferase
MNLPGLLAGFEILAVILFVMTAPLVLELTVLTAASLLPNSLPGFLNRKAPAPGDIRPRSLTFIIPAHNEGLLVERCVKSLVAQFAGQPEAPRNLLVVAHNCEDDTAARAAAAGADVVKLDDPSQRGKACALRFGIAHALNAGAEAVVIVDADSIVGPGFVTKMQDALSSGAEAVQCAYRVLPAVGNDSPTLTGIAFQGFNLVRPLGRDRLGLSAGIFGNGFGLCREVLDRVPYSADSVVEDLEYHIQLVAAGIRVRFVADATVFGEMPVSDVGSQTQRARWEGGRLLMMKAYPRRLLREIQRGHFRLIEPLLDILSLPLAMGVVLLLLALFVPCTWLRWYAAAGLLIVVAHFVAAVHSGPNFWKGLGVLVMVPRYMLWKLVLVPKILLNSRRNASWVRTQRDKPADFSGSVHPDALE